MLESLIHLFPPHYILHMHRSALQDATRATTKFQTKMVLHASGASIRPAEVKEQQRVLDQPLFFFMPNENHGEFCQWYPATFTVSKVKMSRLIGHPIDEDDPEGWQPIYFNCAEQFMMYCKAARFHDVATQARVMATSSPKEQKRLGKLTRGFFDASWDEVKGEVVIAGNMAKFTQNDKLRGKLLATGRRVLVEASGRDRVWGIGYTEKHAMRFQEHWGENRLGKALMVVRDRLRIKELL